MRGYFWFLAAWRKRFGSYSTNPPFPDGLDHRYLPQIPSNHGQKLSLLLFYSRRLVTPWLLRNAPLRLRICISPQPQFNMASFLEWIWGGQKPRRVNGALHAYVWMAGGVKSLCTLNRLPYLHQILRIQNHWPKRTPVERLPPALSDPAGSRTISGSPGGTVSSLGGGSLL